MSKIENILQDYANGKKNCFKFYGFVSPEETDEQYRWAKECGYTHLHFFYYSRGQERLEKALDLAQKYGLKIIWTGEDFIKEERPYAFHPALDGVYVDEPLSIGDLEKLSQELKPFQKKYPGKQFYVNLVGMYGQSWEIYSSYFKEHFLPYANQRFVSSDGYPLREGSGGKTTFTSILESIREIGQLAAETDSEMYYYVQTISMHGDSWGTNAARRPSTEDIRFLHYIILSCGATGFAHFCYRSPDRRATGGEFLEEDYACIHWDGSRTPIWYSAQEVISEFKKFENIVLKFKWKGIMPVRGALASKCNDNFDDLTRYTQSHSYIKEVNAEQDLLIGCFEDAQGNVGFTLVNFCDPYYKKENSVRLVLDTDEPIAIIKDGETKTVSLESGVHSAVLAPGEGQFLIIPKQKETKLVEYIKEVPVPAYLIPPKSHCWKEDFKFGNQVDTYNVYGSGNSHFEFMESGYPEGGSGRVLRLYTSTKTDKDWSSYKFKLPDILVEKNKKLVFKMYFTASAFIAYASCDHMNSQYSKHGVPTLERYGRWTWFEVPLKDLCPENMSVLSEVGLCIGAGVPYGTTAYIDEILVCDM